jgi:hypothetical protein
MHDVPSKRPAWAHARAICIAQPLEAYMKIRTLVSSAMLATAVLVTAALVAVPSADAKTNKPVRGTKVAVADRVPTLDTRPSCADAASEVSETRTVATCQQSEQQARNSLASQWQNFPAADKQSCVAQTNVGGFPSYVQVLVCLELARDARTMKVN